MIKINFRDFTFSHRISHKSNKDIPFTDIVQAINMSTLEDTKKMLVNG